jgi:hypothetical protein
MRRSGPIVTRSLSTSVASRPSPYAVASPHAVAINAPTFGYRRHHDVTAPSIDDRTFRQGWRVCSRLDGLLESGRIDRACWDAAHTWRRAAELVAPVRVQAWSTRVDRSIAPDDAHALRRVAAAARLRETAAALGELRVRILEAVLVKDIPWTELGRLLRLSDKAARDWAVEALEVLADHLAGRPVAPPPVPRYRNEPGRQ